MLWKILLGVWLMSALVFFYFFLFDTPKKGV